LTQTANILSVMPRAVDTIRTALDLTERIFAVLYVSVMGLTRCYKMTVFVFVQISCLQIRPITSVSTAGAAVAVSAQWMGTCTAAERFQDIGFKIL